MRFGPIILAAAVWGLAGCSSDDAPAADSATSTGEVTTSLPSVCIPGQQVPCACPGGLGGVQVCAPDGGSLGPCACPDPGTSSTTAPADTGDSTTTTTTDATTTGDSTTTDGTDTSAPDCFPPCMGKEQCLNGECYCFELLGNYGHCDDDYLCPLGQSCLVDDVSNPTLGACFPTICDDDCECPDGPDGAPSSCDPLLGNGVGYCNVPCSGGAPCPDGMECMFDLCMWPLPGDCCTANDAPGCDEAMCEAIVCAIDLSCCDTVWDQGCVESATIWCDQCSPPPYGDCLHGVACPTGLTCVTDEAESIGWCTLGCVSDADCQPPPPTGTAPAICGPINPMTDACQLNCSMGQTCPTGMVCWGGYACVWEA